MKRLMLVLSAAVLVTACGDPHTAFTQLTPDQVEAMAGTGEAVVLDANGDSTRAEHGVVPGAVLLTGYKSYDLGELPADRAKQLVFYCANTMCSAAPAAADRAREAGYENVGVMPEGIQGWVKAGKPVDEFAQG